MHRHHASSAPRCLTFSGASTTLTESYICGHRSTSSATRSSTSSSSLPRLRTEPTGSLEQRAIGGRGRRLLRLIEVQSSEGAATSCPLLSLLRCKPYRVLLLAARHFLIIASRVPLRPIDRCECTQSYWLRESPSKGSCARDAPARGRFGGSPLSSLPRCNAALVRLLYVHQALCCVATSTAAALPSSTTPRLRPIASHSSPDHRHFLAASCPVPAVCVYISILRID